MFVKLLSGRRAGDVVDMKYLDAKALLDDGRAEFAFPPDPPAEPADPAPPGISPAAAKVVETAKRVQPKKNK